MRIIGCDLHARQQTLAMLDTTTGEVVEMTLKHEGDKKRRAVLDKLRAQLTSSQPHYLPEIFLGDFWLSVASSTFAEAGG
jgi:hypothetical protein